MKTGDRTNTEPSPDEFEAPPPDKDMDIYASEGESFQDLNSFDFAPEDRKSILNHREEAIILPDMLLTPKSSGA